MTAIADHARVHDLTVQGNQAARSRALTRLLELPGMPTVSTWTIDDLSNRLSGLIMADHDEGATEQRAKVQQWAEFLHAEVVETTTAGRVTVSAVGRCEYGVPVRIWASLRPMAAEEAAA